MAVGPEITIARILADLNLAVQYRIAIHTCIRASEKINIGRFNLVVAQADCQTAKLPNSIPLQIFRLYSI